MRGLKGERVFLRLSSVVGDLHPHMGEQRSFLDLDGGW